jgi:hypothetical protein
MARLSERDAADDGGRVGKGAGAQTKSPVRCAPAISR